MRARAESLCVDVRPGTAQSYGGTDRDVMRGCKQR